MKTISKKINLIEIKNIYPNHFTFQHYWSHSYDYKITNVWNYTIYKFYSEKIINDFKFQREYVANTIKKTKRNVFRSLLRKIY